MGGSVRVDSEFGKGSTFTVELPFGMAEADPDTPAAGFADIPKTASGGRAAQRKICDFHGKHILLAEDNELNREIAEELLGEATGAVIESAVDGAQAVEMFKASSHGYYDLILMDVQMPNMDGYEATKAIRDMDRPDAQVVPIFAMTANAFAEDEEKSRRMGMNAHLSKPLEIDMVYARMNEVLSEREEEKSGG